MARTGPGVMSDLSPLSGVERKLDFGAVRSPFDPSETLADKFCCDAQPASPLNVIVSARLESVQEGSPHEAAEIRRTSRRRGGRMAVRCARAAEGDAGDRRPLHRVAQRDYGTVYGPVPPGTERSRLRRGTEFAD